MSSKINRIRRRIQDSKKKSILQSITLNQDLSYFLNGKKAHPTYALKHSITILPAISLPNSQIISPSYSQRPHNACSTMTGNNLNLVETMRHSLCMQSENLTKQNYRRRTNFNVTTSKSLNPALRLQWHTLKNKRVSTDCSIQSPQFHPTHTAPTVIILDPQMTTNPIILRRIPSKKFKRPSPIDIRTFTVPSQQSPMRKCSISAWQGPQQASSPF